MLYAVKELARGLHAPTNADMRQATKVVQYAVSTRDVELKLEFDRSLRGKIQSFGDSNWATGDGRKSTSGGTLRYQGVPIMSWSRTQSTVALSSCEAELCALVEAAREAMFLSSIVCEIEDARSDQTFELMLDASSTMALMRREDLGKLKHVEIRYFLLQDLSKSGRCKITEVKSQNNPADLMTKHLDRQTLTVLPHDQLQPKLSKQSDCSCE